METLTIEITNKCSLNCVHCSTNSKNNGNLFLSTEQIKKILNEFPDFDKIRISGGEPFEHPKLKEILREIRKKNRFIEILSSGVCNGHEIPREIIKQLKKDIGTITFSIYGAEDIHNKICGFSAYNLLKKSIQSIIEEKISFSFVTVIMKDNLSDLENIIHLIHEIKSQVNYCNPKLYILRFIKQGRGKINQKQAIDKEGIKEAIKLCRDFSNKYHVDTIFGCSLKEGDCIQGAGKAAVTIQGERISCSALKYGAKQGKFACKDKW